MTATVSFRARTQEKVGSRDGQNAKNAVVPGAKAAPTLSRRGVLYRCTTLSHSGNSISSAIFFLRSHQKPVKEEPSSTGTQGGAAEAVVAE